jgi:hypothetical protein
MVNKAAKLPLPVSVVMIMLTGFDSVSIALYNCIGIGNKCNRHTKLLLPLYPKEVNDALPHGHTNDFVETL